MALNFHRQLNGLQFIPQNTITPSVLGEVRYNSSTNKLELFDGIVDNIVTEAGSAPISNKTLVNDTVGASSTNDIGNSLVFTELASTPSSNPSAGNLAFYAKADGIIYSLNSSGVESPASFSTIPDSTILSNISGSSAFPSANTLSAIIDHDVDATQGDILYRSASSWIALPPGSAGQFLATGGAGANPSWVAATGSGSVTSVALTVPSFLSIAGSPITTSGTLAISLSGTALPIPNGGTGQTTASASFAALSPLTVTGDLLSFTTVPVRVPIGTSGQILTVSGGAPTWSTTPASNPTVVLQSTTLNPAVVNTTYLLSGTSFTITLPTAIGAMGSIITFKHLGVSFTQQYQLNTTGGQTVGGVTSGQYILQTNQETLAIVSDGSNWITLNHLTTMPMVASTTVGLSTGAFGATIIKEWRLQREGNYLIGQLVVVQTGAGTAGSGEYHLTVPFGLAIDATIAPFYAGSNPYVAISTSSLSSTCNVLVDAGTLPQIIGQLCAINPFAVRMVGTYYNNGNTLETVSETWASGDVSLGNSTLALIFSFKIPIAGWQQ